ncbi:MAG: alpha/beta hydrolase [Oligosphaeraceae bacterium]|nr:alpha/beta hydrolase [Oligosphaeraceae bacterium]
MNNKFPPFAIPIGNADPNEEPLFPDGFPGIDTDAAAAMICSNPEPAEQAGYLDRHLSNVRVPTMLSYPADPAIRKSAAVLICPGGGYQVLAFDKEGTDLARFFNSFGVNAFVLKYQLSWQGDKKGVYPYAPLRSAQRALRLIRQRAAELGIDRNKVGIMGFSAGAHLAATASTMFDDVDEPKAELREFSARPDFSILIYAVISMVAAYRHQGSQINLLGETASEELKRRFSPELNVSDTTPPAFMVHCLDDPVFVDNSLCYLEALRQKNIKAEMHLYAEGGHGYGMRQKGSSLDQWPQALKHFMLDLLK